MAAQAQDIVNSLTRTVSHSQNLSESPTATFTSHASFSGGHSSSNALAGQLNAKPLKPFNSTDIKILLLENVNQTGQDILNEQGYQVEVLKTSLDEDALIEKIRYEFPRLLGTKKSMGN